MKTFMCHKSWCVVVLFLSLFIVPCAGQQNPCSLKKSFEAHAIQDTSCIKGTNDSIRYIINAPTSEKKPVIVFLQGSGNAPLTSYDDTECYFLGSPFNWTQLKDQYYFVFISKPSVPLWSKLKEDGPVMIDTTIGNYHNFTLNDTKDYYVNSTIAVLQELKKQNYVDTSRIYLIGHSQGASVACKVAALRPDLVTKAIYASSSPFGRDVQDIISIYKSVFQQKMTYEEAQVEIDKIYSYYKDLKEVSRSAIDSGDFFPLNSFSFNYDLSKNYFNKIKIPFLVVYGTADLKSMDLSLLPLFLIADNKDNIKVKAYPGYDHNFFKVDQSGVPIFEEYHWDEVFMDMVNWLKE